MICGMISETTTDGKIVFHKTLCIDPDFIDTGSHQLQVSGVKTGSAVRISCEYDASATVNTDDVTVTAGEASTADSGQGDFSESLTLMFYIDASLTTPDVSGSQTVGDTIYVGVRWNQEALSDVFNFYVKDCFVQNSNDVGSHAGVKVC